MIEARPAAGWIDRELPNAAKISGLPLPPLEAVIQHSGLIGNSKRLEEHLQPRATPWRVDRQKLVLPAGAVQALEVVVHGPSATELHTSGCDPFDRRAG